MKKTAIICVLLFVLTCQILSSCTMKEETLGTTESQITSETTTHQEESESITETSETTETSGEVTQTEETIESWEIQDLETNNEILPIVDVSEEGVTVTNDGFDELNQRLEEICSNIKEQYQNHKIEYLIYRCDKNILSLRIVVLCVGEDMLLSDAL